MHHNIERVSWLVIETGFHPNKRLLKQMIM